MKKKIYPCGFSYFMTMTLFFLIVLFCLCIIGLCAYKLFAFRAYVLIIPITAALSSAILFGFIFICNISNKIILNDKVITATGQKMKGKIQHREFINFFEIKNIKLLCAHTDSQGKKLNNVGIASLRPHMFFEFILQNESSKLIYIEIYSVKQRKKILDIINKMTNLNFLYNQLENTDESIFRRKERKNKM